MSEPKESAEVKETCGYCSHFQFGYCEFHGRRVSSDDEICAEIKACRQEGS